MARRFQVVRAAGRPVRRMWPALLVVLGVLVVVAAVLSQALSLSRTQEDVDALAGAFDQANRQLTDTGQQPVATPSLASTPSPSSPPTPSPPATDVPSYPSGAVRSAVGAVLADDPSLVQPAVAFAVADYLRSNPPADAPPVSDGQLARVVASWMAANPAPVPSGSTVTLAPSPVDADTLAAQVAAYLADNPAPPGSAGRDGADGRDGRDGTDGVPGAPGAPPVGWTFAVGVVPYACTRADGFDPTAPTYTCAPLTPPTSDPPTSDPPTTDPPSDPPTDPPTTDPAALPDPVPTDGPTDPTTPEVP